MTEYQIRDWNKYFENNRSREFKKLNWVPMPNKHDGDSYRELVDHPNGAAHYGAWCVCVGVASKSQPRGSLLRDGCVPHDSISLSRKTGIPAKVFEEALPRFVSIGWMDVKHSESMIPQRAAEIPQATAAPSTLNGIELNGIEQKEKKPQAAYSPSFEEVWKHYPEKGEKRKAYKAYQNAIKEGCSDDVIIAGIQRYLANVQWRRDNGFKELQYRGGGVFFHGRNWEDEWTIPSNRTPVQSTQSTTLTDEDIAQI